MITCLKDLGMPLKEIKVYIDARNPEDLASLLLEQKKKVRDQLSHLQRIQQVIENKLDLLYEGQSTRILTVVPLLTLRNTRPKHF